MAWAHSYRSSSRDTSDTCIATNHTQTYTHTLTAVLIILEDGGCKKDYAVVIEYKEEPNWPEQKCGLPHSILEQVQDEIAV